MVAMQPLMEPGAQISVTEPFRWLATSKGSQIDHIRSTLEIARKAHHGAGKTHFTLLPEYAIPGLDGFDAVQATLSGSQWPAGTVVIGGIDALTKAEYAKLCSRQGVLTHPSNGPDTVHDRQWVNCSSTWIKTASQENSHAQVTSWLQPKLRPSWNETGRVSDMFEGKAINVFECHAHASLAFRFLSLICFDWVARIGDSTGIMALLKEMNSLPGASPYGKQLHLVVVLQNNPEPNHNSFLGITRTFFQDQTCPCVQRDKCVVCFVNGAGSERPGYCPKYGFSCLVFSPVSTYQPYASPPSYAVDTAVRRGNGLLSPCQEALFRESGECVHSFRLYHPWQLAPTPENPRLPLSPVLVNSLSGRDRDPRTPDAQVSAAVKWVNDELDCPPQFDSRSPLCNDLNTSRAAVIGQLRWAEEQQLLRAVLLGATLGDQKRITHVDAWGDAHKNCLANIVFVLSVLGCACQVIPAGSDSHAVLVHDDQVYEVLVVTGRTHLKNREFVTGNYAGRPAAKTLIISYDQTECPITPRDRSIYDTDTDTRFVSAYELKACLAASTLAELRQKVRAVVQ